MAKRKESKYLEFVHLENKPKTRVYQVRSKLYGFGLGLIKYYPAWRQYSFFSFEGSVFNRECLKDIINFINDEEQIRKNK